MTRVVHSILETMKNLIQAMDCLLMHGCRCRNRIRRMISEEIKIMSALRKKTNNRTLVKRWNNVYGQMQ